jgi:hypothetical protein
MSIEIVLANGKRLVSESGREVANFYASKGTSIADPPRKNPKRDKRGKRVPQKVG